MGKTKHSWPNLAFHGFLHWIRLSVWIDGPTSQTKQDPEPPLWHSRFKIRDVLLPHGGGAASQTQNWWKNHLLLLILDFRTTHCEMWEQPTTNFSKGIDILPNKMTICTQHWRSLSWQMASPPLRTSPGATTRRGSFTAGGRGVGGGIRHLFVLASWSYVHAVSEITAHNWHLGILQENWSNIIVIWDTKNTY